MIQPVHPGIFIKPNGPGTNDYVTTDEQLLLRIFRCPLSNVMCIYTHAYMTDHETRIIAQHMYDHFILPHRTRILISDMTDKEGGWEDSFPAVYEFSHIYHKAGLEYVFIIPPEDFFSHHSMNTFFSVPLPFQVYFSTSRVDAINTIRAHKLIPDEAVIGGI